MYIKPLSGRESPCAVEKTLSQNASMFGRIEHFMFIMTVFFYPISLVSHVLYLVPLLALLGMSMTNRRKRLYLSDFSAIILGLGAFTIPFLVEFGSSVPSQELTSKLIVNVIAIWIMAGNERLIFSHKTLRHLKFVCLAWMVIVLVIYIRSGVTSVSAVWAQLNASSEINSSSLYGIAEPLRDVFLTKNISAMFVVSVFSLYLYIARNLNRKVSVLEFLMFFAAALVFLSRQAILGMIVIYGFYRFIVAGYLSRGVILAILGAVAMFFFTSFFDLKNSNDGASQRILLWQYFFSHYQNFFFFGNGVVKLNTILNSTYGIDNFHMFFMNQIGAYGFIHFVLFSAFLIMIFIRKGPQKSRVLLVVGYLLNVCFQTYGYEYGNLFLFMAMFASISDSERYKLPKIKLK